MGRERRQARFDLPRTMNVTAIIAKPSHVSALVLGSGRGEPLLVCGPPVVLLLEMLLASMAPVLPLPRTSTAKN